MICNPIYRGLFMQTYSLSPANIAIAVLKSINIRHFGAKKIPLQSKQENTHYNQKLQMHGLLPYS